MKCACFRILYIDGHASEKNNVQILSKDLQCMVGNKQVLLVGMISNCIREELCGLTPAFCCFQPGYVEEKQINHCK
jgi:hypothetical protein